MAKKKKRKKAVDSHQKHHQAIHQYIMRKRLEDGEIEGASISHEHHTMPRHQVWHVASTTCPCLPFKVSEATDGTTVWMHRGWVH